MIDLIYCGYEHYDECKNELQREFPDSIIADASDEIHEGRFSIEVPDEKRKQLLVFLLDKGYYDMSLKLNLMSRIEESKKEFNELVECVVNRRQP